MNFNAKKSNFFFLIFLVSYFWVKVPAVDATGECSDEVGMIEILHILSLSFFLWSSIEVTMEGQMQFVSDCKIQRRREDLAWFITKILSQQRSYVTWLSRCVTIKVTMQLQWNAAELLKPTFFYLWRQAKNRNKT